MFFQSHYSQASFQVFALPNADECLLDRDGVQLVLQCEPSKVVSGLKRLFAGEYLQDAFPFLSSGEREFILSGITPAAWEEMFGRDEE